MKHKVFGRKLNRDIKERKALFKSLIIALITHGRIRTTLAKAKAIQGLIDKLVTKAKDNSSSTRKQLTSFIARRESINKLIQVIVPRFKSKAGGYSRMIKIGKRKGNGSEKVILEWSLSNKEGEKPQNADKKAKKRKET